MSPGSHRRAWTLLVPLVLGCYVPAPADPAALARGADLRIRLSVEARERLNEPSEELMGEFLGMSSDSLTIATRLRVPAYAGSSVSMLRQSFTFAREDIVQVTVPRLDRRRTALVLGGALVLATVVALDLFDIRGNGGGGLPPDPPDSGSPFWNPW